MNKSKTKLGTKDNWCRSGFFKKIYCVNALVNAKNAKARGCFKWLLYKQMVIFINGLPEATNSRQCIFTEVMICFLGLARSSSTISSFPLCFFVVCLPLFVEDAWFQFCVVFFLSRKQKTSPQQILGWPLSPIVSIRVISDWKTRGPGGATISGLWVASKANNSPLCVRYGEPI